MSIVSLRLVRHTTDFDSMLSFYRDRLGMKVVRSWSHPGNRGALLSPGDGLGSMTIELLNYGKQAKRDVAPANVDLTIEVSDVEQWRRRLRAHGAPVVAEIEDKPWGHRAFSVEDPDSLRVTLYQVIETSL